MRGLPAAVPAPNPRIVAKDPDRRIRVRCQAGIPA